MTQAEDDLVERCESCGCANLVWYAPNALWNLVVGGPDAKGDPGGFLCPNCFIARAEAAGIKPTAWKIAPETDADLEAAAEIARLRGEIEIMAPLPSKSQADEIARLRAAIEALVGAERWQWHGSYIRNTDPDWVAEATEPHASALSFTHLTGGLVVHTPRGDVMAQKGDWLLRDGDKAWIAPPALSRAVEDARGALSTGSQEADRVEEQS